MKKINVLLLAFLLLSFWANAQQYPFNGLDMNMGNLSRLSNAQSRSISPENFTGEKGKGAMADPVRDKDVRNKANAAGPAKDLGKGWKVNPFIIVKPGETVTIAEIDGPGAIQQIWMTPTGDSRYSVCIGTTRKSLQLNVRSGISSPVLLMSMLNFPRWRSV